MSISRITDLLVSLQFHRARLLEMQERMAEGIDLIEPLWESDRVIDHFTTLHGTLSLLTDDFTTALEQLMCLEEYERGNHPGIHQEQHVSDEYQTD